MQLSKMRRPRKNQNVPKPSVIRTLTANPKMMMIAVSSWGIRPNIPIVGMSRNWAATDVRARRRLRSQTFQVRTKVNSKAMPAIPIIAVVISPTTIPPIPKAAKIRDGIINIMRIGDAKTVESRIPPNAPSGERAAELKTMPRIAPISTPITLYTMNPNTRATEYSPSISPRMRQTTKATAIPTKEYRSARKMARIFPR